MKLGIIDVGGGLVLRKADIQPGDDCNVCVVAHTGGGACCDKSSVFYAAAASLALRKTVSDKKCCDMVQYAEYIDNDVLRNFSVRGNI